MDKEKILDQLELTLINFVKEIAGKERIATTGSELVAMTEAANTIVQIELVKSNCRIK